MRNPGVIHLEQCGQVDHTGTVDSSDAFAAAFAFAASLRAADPSAVSSNPTGRAKIVIPPGDFLITQPKALMDTELLIGRMFGLKFEGAGRQATRLIFDPATSGYLAENHDFLLGLKFEGITFVGMDPDSSFMLSDSDGGAQDYRFTDCMWEGTWDAGLELTGSNTNSEMLWDHCRWAGTTQRGHLRSTSATASDQFLNYTFLNPIAHFNTGDWIHLEEGGSVRVFGGSIIEYGPAGATGEGEGCFFRLGNGANARSTTSLTVEGVRFENRSEGYLIADIRWTNGIVAFRDCDESSPLGVYPSVVQHKYDFGNTSGPVVSYENCRLIGQHEYEAGIGYNSQRSVTYTGCQLDNYLEAEDFIVSTGATSDGSKTPVRFTNCRSKAAFNDEGESVIDTVVNGAVTQVSRHQGSVSVKNGGGKLPLSGETSHLTLPRSAIITSVRWLCPPSAMGSTATDWSLTLETTDGAPATVASVAPGTALSAGYSQVDAPLNFLCDTDERRMLTLKSNTAKDQSSKYEHCIVEYIA